MESNKTTPRLLLVDDEEDFRRATSTALARRGFSIEEAGDGEQALAAIKRELPDVVVLDLKMPGMSGIETLQRNACHNDTSTCGKLLWHTPSSPPAGS